MAHRFLAKPPLCQAPADPGAGPIPAGVHIVRGDSPGGSLKTAGAKPVIALPDNLALGPSSRSVRLHPKVRERYWRMEYAAARYHDEPADRDMVELLSASAVMARVANARAEPVYLWCSGFWSDLLFLGWLLESTAKSDGSWSSPMLAGDLRQSMPLGWWTPAQLFPLGRDAQPVDAQLREELVEVWRAFTEPSPAHLERLRRSPPAHLPTFVEGLGAAFASLLPRRLGRRRGLQLSAVDEVILRLIPATRRARFPDLFKGSSGPRARWPKAGLFAMLSYYGEAFIHARIAGWTLGPAAAIAELDEPRTPDDHHPFTWRLTERGRALLADGLDGPEDCPDQIIGGYRTGRGDEWCCAVTAGGWRLEPCP